MRLARQTPLHWDYETSLQPVAIDGFFCSLDCKPGDLATGKSKVKPLSPQESWPKNLTEILNDLNDFNRVLLAFAFHSFPLSLWVMSNVNGLI